MQPKLLTVEEAAEVLRLGRTKTYDLIRDGELAVVKTGRLTRVPISSVNEWIERNTRRLTSQAAS